MKNRIQLFSTIIFIMLFTSNSIAQIGTGKKVEKPDLIGVADRMVGYPKLEVYRNQDEKDYYVISFMNLEYPNIDDLKIIDFYANGEELNGLFDFLIGCFENKDLNEIDVGDQKLYIIKTASSLRISVEFLKEPEPSGWFFVSKRQLERMFGKR